jgi:hypothetical protein
MEIKTRHHSDYFQAQLRQYTPTQQIHQTPFLYSQKDLTLPPISRTPLSKPLQSSSQHLPVPLEELLKQ